MNRKVLFEEAVSLQLMLTTFATGGEADDGGYRRIRSIFVQNPEFSEFAPQFLRACRSLSDFWSFIKGEFAHYQERRDFLRTEFDPLLSHLEFSTATPADANADKILKKVDSPHVHRVWLRAVQRRASDPEGAITLARTLLEAVCKHILDKEGIDYDPQTDLPKLYTLTAKQLNLSPSQHLEPIFKQILGGCHSVVQGLGSLRSKLGDAHGQGARPIKPAPRHAELAVNLAGTVATFLITTWEERAKPQSRTESAAKAFNGKL